MVFSPAADFADVCDGLEAVTLLPRGSGPSVSIAHALERSVSRSELAESDGWYLAGDVRWHLPVEECASEPRPGDRILDGDGAYWTILAVEKATLGARWACTARDVAIAYGLDDTVTILKATYAKGESGAGEPTWTPHKTGVRARIQPLDAAMGAESELRRTVRNFRIFIAEDATLTHEHRVRGPDGTLYKITGTTGAERIGELMTIEAEVTPWPLA